MCLGGYVSCPPIIYLYQRNIVLTSQMQELKGSRPPWWCDWHTGGTLVAVAGTLLALVSLPQLPYELLRDGVVCGHVRGSDMPAWSRWNRLRGLLLYFGVVFWGCILGLYSGLRNRRLLVRGKAGGAAFLRGSACCRGIAEEGPRGGER